MKKSNSFKIFAVIALAFLSFSYHAQNNSQIWATLPNELIVPSLNSDGQLYSSNAEFNALISSLSITNVVKALPASKQDKLQKVYEISCNCSEQQLVDAFTKASSIAQKIVVAPKYEALYTTNDYNLEFSTDYALDLINASGAWDITHGNSNIVIGISDQNFNINHEELVGKAVYYDASNVSTPTHGTSVAIVAAGNTDNNIGKSSIGFNSSLALYQMSYNEILVASYAGLDIINLSWTSGCFYNQYAQDVVDEAYNNGSFLLAAAGNGTTCGSAEQLVYPSAHNNVFSVTSIGFNDSHEQIAGDPLSTHQHNSTVDMSAPGYNVAISPAPGWYLTSSGTSFATPLVSGIVALMLDVNPCLNNLDIEYILKTSATNIDTLNPSYIGKIGTGRVNAAAAVLMASTFVSTPIQTNAEVVGSCVANSSSILINPSGGQTPYTVQWSNNATEMFLDNLPAGSYNLQILDARGCVLDTAIDVTTSPAALLTSNQVNISCFGSNNGSIDVTVLLGTPNFSYAWDNGATTEDLSNLSPGTYRLVLTDGNGCKTSSSYTITTTSQLNASVITSTANSSNNGAIDLSVSGGTPAYTYQWNTNETIEDLSNLAAGNYSVTVTDANGCQTIVNAEVMIESTNALIDQENNEWMIYPNPTNNDATIEWGNNDIDELIVTDSNGKIMSRNTVVNENNYKVQNLSSGVYFVTIYQLNEKIGSRKLIVL